MKRIFAVCVALLAVLSFSIADAEAKRLGGGRSIGMQRTPVTQPARQAGTTSPQAPTAAPGVNGQPAAAPSGLRRWAAPLAGLAAGLGLAALASHFGMSGEFGSILLMVGLGLVAFMLIRRFMAPKASPQTAAQYAGAGAPFGAQPAQFNAPGSGAAPLASTSRIPAGFDVDGFVRNAKVSFIRLQAAFDAGNLDDIREFTSPEMFAELKLDIDGRAGAANKTDVVTLNGELLDVSDEGARHIASVRFTGMLREDAGAAPQAFDEVWHLAKPIDGSRGWVLAGIEQMQ